MGSASEYKQSSIRFHHWQSDQTTEVTSSKRTGNDTMLSIQKPGMGSASEYKRSSILGKRSRSRPRSESAYHTSDDERDEDDEEKERTGRAKRNKR
jgi:hypothetical protein